MCKNGHITIFFSLILMCIVSLMCGLLESARTAGARCYLKLAADSAMDSVFSRYHRDGWEKYRLFLLECEDRAGLEADWKKFLKPYMESSGWYSMDMERADTVQLLHITDDGGKYLNQEILDYMKFGVFKNITNENDAQVLFQNLKEGDTVKNLSGAYGGHTEEAVRLERALQDIGDSLSRQKEYWKRGNEQVENYDGGGFRIEADRLIHEMDRMPFLIKAYEKRAEELKKSLKETNHVLTKSQEELSQEIHNALVEETQYYESYLNQDGNRRREIENLPKQIMELKQVVEGAKARSIEVEEIILNWDEEDEEGPDVSALWESVREIWDEAVIPRLSWSTGVKESEKYRILEQVEGLIQKKLLDLVIPEGGEISRGILNNEDFPSKSYENGEESKENLMNRILFQEYCGAFLTCFTSEENKEVQYELEYLVSGKNTDEENLKRTVEGILAIRQGLNLIHILSDSNKRNEAKALATIITGVTGMTPLTGMVAFFVMNIWALGESIVDIRMLLSGEKAAFIKSGETWNLSLDALLQSGTTGEWDQGKEVSKGINYEGYLKLLLFMGKPVPQYYRLMDIIQMNLRRKQEDFRMAHCIYQAEIRGTVKTKHMFFGGSNPYYSVEVGTEKAY